MPAWRKPTARERALFDVLSLAGIRVRRTLAAQLADIRVAADGDGHGLVLDVGPGAGRMHDLADGELLAAQGVDPGGRRVLVALHVEAGAVCRLELAGLDTAECALPAPESLRLMDAVPRGTLSLHWMVPHERTILDEAASATP